MLEDMRAEYGKEIYQQGWEEGFRQGWEEGFRRAIEESGFLSLLAVIADEQIILARELLMGGLEMRHKLSESQLAVIRDEIEQIDSPSILVELYRIGMQCNEYDAFRTSMDKIIGESTIKVEIMEILRDDSACTQHRPAINGRG
ncbi:MAG: hypothetical protein AAF639_47710 [Chloroflexota bacterium]